MSVSKTGWIIAAATAAAFAAGCAGQSHTDNAGASCAGEPAVAATHGCKGMSECKSKAENNNKVVKHHRHHSKKVMKDENNANGKVEKTEKTEEETTTKEENTEAK